MPGSSPSGFDATDLAVLSSRMESIVREMENTVLRTARSSVVGLSKDFSCSIVSSDDELLFSAEGLPVHVFGSGLLTAAMRHLQPNFSDGDAFLHNDPYLGNTHAADQSVLVPVFVDGMHLFTTVVKAHQADIGNSLPTTYMAHARDVYEEGALIFPCVHVQAQREDVDDVIRMGRTMIRVGDIWYGDYLAAIAAARVGERRLQEMAEHFGVPRLCDFVAAWLDYSERRVRDAIRELPEGRFEAVGQFGPASGAPDGIPVKVTVDVDRTRGRVQVDLRDNPDCVPSGLNMTEATATNAAIVGIVIALNSRGRDDRTPIPLNAGSFRNFDVKLRENCVLGIPRHPASCSMATGGPSKTVVLLELSALAELTGTLGSTYPGNGPGPGDGVVSGFDPRTGRNFITQLFCGTSGGPATASTDGWLSFLAIGAAGLLYRDSVEVLEQKYPILIRTSRVRPDSEGAGYRRGASGNIAEYGPLGTSLQVHYLIDGPECLPRGVSGGQAGAVTEAYVVRSDGRVDRLEASVDAVELHTGEIIGSRSGGGGGFGDPLEREPELVVDDVREGYLSPGRAESHYGVVITGDANRPETLDMDRELTDSRRRHRSAEATRRSTR